MCSHLTCCAAVNPAPVAQAIDHTTQVLSLHHNRRDPVIFNTYQAYLKDSHTRLLEDMERARREGYTFAAKLVGGPGAGAWVHRLTGGLAFCLGLCMRVRVFSRRDSLMPSRRAAPLDHVAHAVPL